MQPLPLICGKHHHPRHHHHHQWWFTRIIILVIIFKTISIGIRIVITLLSFYCQNCDLTGLLVASYSYCSLYLLSLFYLLPHHQVSRLPHIHAADWGGWTFLEAWQTCRHNAEKSKVSSSWNDIVYLTSWSFYSKVVAATFHDLFMVHNWSPSWHQEGWVQLATTCSGSTVRRRFWPRRNHRWKLS